MIESTTLLYDVTFFTYGEPDPQNLGAAKKMLGKVRVWATHAEQAIDFAKQVADLKGAEYLSTADVTSVSGIILEAIANDPLNPYAILRNEPTETAPALTLVT